MVDPPWGSRSRSPEPFLHSARERAAVFWITRGSAP